MLRLQIRLVKDNGTTDASSRVLETQQISYNSALNGTPTLSFQVSRDSFAPTVYPFVVRVEYSTGGAYKPVPDNDLFIIQEDSGDVKDVANIASYTGEGYVPWLLSGGLIAWNKSAKDGRRKWVEPGNKPASAGWVLSGMINELQVPNGWFPMLTKTFNGTTDSKGVTWKAADKNIQEWELTKNLAEVLNQMVESGMCDWVARGVALNLFTPDTLGSDKAHLSIGGGEGYSRAPIKVDSSGMFTHIRAIPDEMPWQNHQTNAAMRARFGERSIALTQSGIKDKASSDRDAKPLLAGGGRVDREEAFEWTPQGNMVYPFKDIRLGDHITAISRGKQVRRVIYILAEQTEQAYATVQVRVGEKIGSAGSKLSQRLKSVSSGSNVGGSGSGFPASPGPLPLAPKAPQGLIVTHNESTWSSSYEPLTSVGLAWTMVTEATDDTESVVNQYEVWSRYTNEVRKRDAAVAAPDVSVDITSWLPGRTRYVSVRARSTNGRWSEFSPEIEVTPNIPHALVPKAPQNFRVVSNVGEFTSFGAIAKVLLRWDPVTETVDGSDVELSIYDVWRDLGIIGNVAPTATTFEVNVTSGISASFTVTATSDNSLTSDPSNVVTVVGATPAMVNRKPSTPVLTNIMGGVLASWDGLYDTTNLNGAFRVNVEKQVGASWVNQGILTDANSVAVAGSVGSTVVVRFTAMDQLGRLTGTSATASLEVTGVDLGDLDQDILDFLEEVENTADNAWDAASTSVKSTVTQYAVSGSETVPPTTGWSPDSPVRTPGTFIWMRAIVTYGDGSTSTMSPALITGNDGSSGSDGTPGAPGAPGAPGVGVSSVTQYYQLTSATAAAPAKPTVMTPPAPWVASEPAFQSNTALWVVTRVVYSNNTFSYSNVSKVSAYTASTLADGKLTLSTTNPTVGQGTGKAPGSLWMAKTGGAFTSMWEWNGTAWVSVPLSETIIPKVAIGTGTYGELEGDRLKARSVQASKVIVGDVENLIRDPGFNDPDAWSPGNSTKGIIGRTAPGVPADPPVADNVYRVGSASPSNNDVQFLPGTLRNSIAVTPGEEFYVEYWVARDTACNSNFRFFMATRDATGGSTNWPSAGSDTPSSIPAGIWVKRVSKILIPLNKFEATLQFGATTTGATPPEGSWFVANPIYRRMNTGDMLVDGTITARKIVMDEGFTDKFWTNEHQAGKITTSFLHADVGEQLNIFGNVTIQGINTELDTQADNIANAIEVATEAEDTANTVRQDLSDAAEAIDGLADELTDHKNKFVFANGVLSLVNPTTTNEVRVTSNRIEIVQGGNATSYWDAATFIVTNIRVGGGEIGNHLVEKRDTIGTVWRPI